VAGGAVAAKQVANEVNAAKQAAKQTASELNTIAIDTVPLNQPILVTAKGVAITPETLAIQGTSKLVGVFTGLEGATIEEIISRVPINWKLASQEKGLGIRFIDELGVERVRLHGPSANTPAGSNSSLGWTLRIHVPGTKNSYYDSFGNVVGPKANDGHIPISGNPKAGF
jgi:hypothetical protein